MQLRPDIQIQSVIKALCDVIVPSIDPENKLAREQSKIVIGMLNLLAQQLPLQFRFDCDELQRWLRLSQDLQSTLVAPSSLSNSVLQGLQQQSHVAQDTLDRARADPSEVHLAVRELRAVISELVDSVFATSDDESCAQLQLLLLRSSKDQLLRDRSWLLPQGWEPSPEKIPSIEVLVPPRELSGRTKPADNSDAYQSRLS